MTNNTKTLFVVSGGLSEESTTHRLAEAFATQVVEQSAARGVDVDVRRLNIRDVAQEVAAASVTGFASGDLADAYRDLAQADGVIAVSPTYKASYTGLFKAFWDVTDDGVLAGVPVIVGATGGTPRHSLVTDTAMRPLFAYMKALTMPTAVYAAAEDWGSAGLTSRIGEAASELVTSMGAPAAEQDDRDASSALTSTSTSSSPSTKGVRTLSGTRRRAVDPFTNVPTMEALLRG